MGDPRRPALRGRPPARGRPRVPPRGGSKQRAAGAAPSGSSPAPGCGPHRSPAPNATATGCCSAGSRPEPELRSGRRRGRARRSLRLAAIPLDRALEAVAQRRPRAEAELALGARGVEPAARLAVGLGGVPDDLAGEADEFGDQLGEPGDRDLLTGAEVDRLGTRIAAGGGDDPLGGVVDEEELARGSCPSPSRRSSRRPRHRLLALLDQRGDHVRGALVEVVTRAVEVDRQQVDRPRSRTAGGRPGAGRAASSSRARRARWSPPGSRSRDPLR